MSERTAGDAVVAGFEPFGGRRDNRSWLVARTLAEQRGLASVCLPVDFCALPDAVRRLRETGAGALLLLGEAPGRTLRVEQLALNVLHASRPDNAGRRAQGEAVEAGQPTVRSAGWDALAVARRMQDVGVAAEPSFHAGTYACNAAYYLALGGAPGAVGFVHVPRRGWPYGPELSALVRAAAVALDSLGPASVGDGGARE